MVKHLIYVNSVTRQGRFSLRYSSCHNWVTNVSESVNECHQIIATNDCKGNELISTPDEKCTMTIRWTIYPCFNINIKRIDRGDRSSSIYPSLTNTNECFSKRETIESHPMLSISLYPSIFPLFLFLSRSRF